MKQTHGSTLTSLWRELPSIIKTIRSVLWYLSPSIDVPFSSRMFKIPSDLEKISWPHRLVIKNRNLFACEDELVTGPIIASQTLSYLRTSLVHNSLPSSLFCKRNNTMLSIENDLHYITLFLGIQQIASALSLNESTRNDRYLPTR